MVAPAADAIDRARSSTAPRDAPTSQTSPRAACVSTNARASWSRSCAEEDSISRIVGPGTEGLIALLPAAVPGHRLQPRHAADIRSIQPLGPWSSVLVSAAWFARLLLGRRRFAAIVGRRGARAAFGRRGT